MTAHWCLNLGAMTSSSTPTATRWALWLSQRIKVMPKDDRRMAPGSDRWDLVLSLEDTEAMALDVTLDTGVRTARVQVTVSYSDQNGNRWYAERIIRMRVKKD